MLCSNNKSISNNKLSSIVGLSVSTVRKIRINLGMEYNDFVIEQSLTVFSNVTTAHTQLNAVIPLLDNIADQQKLTELRESLTTALNSLEHNKNILKNCKITLKTTH